MEDSGFGYDPNLIKLAAALAGPAIQIFSLLYAL